MATGERRGERERADCGRNRRQLLSGCLGVICPVIRLVRVQAQSLLQDEPCHVVIEKLERSIKNIILPLREVNVNSSASL